MARSSSAFEKSPIAFIGSYVPRRCGIATFTNDLCTAVALQGGDNYDVFAVAMNDVPEGYPYPDRVRFEVRQPAQADYRLAAEFLNIHAVSAVCLQHEYGIFGGTWGAHVLALLRRLRRPLVTTLHTVLKDPSDQQKLVLQEIGRLSDKMVVMSEAAVGTLHDVFDVATEKIVMIPHGIPDVPFVDPTFYKDQFGVDGKKVLMTFGLLSPGKGLEYVIDALPAVVSKFPDVVYIILGATHPHVKRESGEEYRNSLARRASELKLDDHVIFVNRFVELSELCEYLGATDIYITPYLGAEQIVSGTLAYALGTGKAVVSTPYRYAEEMLAEERGIVVPFQDSRAISTAVLELLGSENRRNTIRKLAYNFCRKMIWKRVGQDYLDLFAEATEAWVEKRHKAVPKAARGSLTKMDELPEIDLRHLRTLTDDTGILQHCRYCTPDRSHGYCTDDNARALIVASMLWDQTHDESAAELMQTYLSYLAHAFDADAGKFRNFMNYDRTWPDEPSSDDCHGRAIWGLGMGVALCPHESMIALATRLLLQGMPATESFTAPRGIAFAIVGLHAYLRRFGGDSEVRRYRKVLAEKLFRQFTDNMSDDWPWCEDILAYANAKLPHALLMSGKWMNRGDMIDVGKRALEWLIEIQTNPDGMLSFVGTSGWYRRGEEKPQFDQQPIEAHALVDACIEAYHVTREERWIDRARRALNWFLGDNDLRTPIYDFTTGGCRDGLHADRVNENQGAESTLAWLMSLLLMHDLQMEQTLGEPAADKSTGQRPVRKPIRPSGPVVGARARKDGITDSDGK